jgi:hypothetical protein
LTLKARAQNVRVALIGNDHLGERLTRRLVDQGSMKVDLYRFLDDARLDIDDLHVFDIGKPRRQGHAGGIALPCA